MDKQILNFTVNEQILVCENPIKISTNKVNYIEAHFTLGDNWSGYDSVRAVWFNDFYCISTVLDSNGVAFVPSEVMKRNGKVKVNLVGSISEDDVLTDRLTSYPVVAVIVDCTAQITGANTSPITPSEFELFAQRVHTDAERAEAGATASEQSAQNAHTSEQNASQSAQSAHDDKIAIEEAIAEVIRQIEDFEQVQVVVNTLPPTSPATSDFTDGVLTLGIPQGVKGDTGNGIQSIRKTGTSGLVDTYTITYTDGQTTTFTVTNGAKGDTGNGIASIEKTSTVGLVDTYTITYTDGNTTTFTVTNGEKGDKGDTGEVSLSELEQATVVQTLSDTEPYNYRRTNNGQGSGHREYDEIVGASVGWNQLVNADTSDWIADVSQKNYIYPCQFRLGHKYYVHEEAKLDDASANFTFISVGFWNSGMNKFVRERIDSARVNNGWSGIVSWTTLPSGITEADLSQFVFQYISSIGPDSTMQYRHFQVTDLTLLNSAIADYVYSLEQSTAGSGVAWLKTHFPKLFDNGYQPFDSGSIKSVSGLTAHEMVGKNLFDKSNAVIGKWLDINTGRETSTGNNYALSDYIPVIAGQTYTITNPQSGRRWLYDSNKQPLSQISGLTFTPTQSGYARFTVSVQTVSLDTIQLEMGSVNTAFEPYEHHTYTLDPSVTLRGKYVLDNGQLKAVGDVYKSSGTKDVNYAEVVLDGSADEDWTNKTSLNNRWSYTNADIKNTSGNTTTIANAVASYLPTISQADMASSSQQNAIAVFGWGNQFVVSIVGITTVADLRAYLANHPLTVVYEKATPTTEQATPYTSPQWCDSKGTEEYVGSELPVGHNTQYPMTMVDCADGLGNGTYTPKLTVTNGKLTFEWQSV